MTIHETQGQTLSRVILLLGRQRGLSVGTITWSLLYVALSRTKKLSDIKFFPSKGGWKDFEYLTKLKPSPTFIKWSQSYRNGRWNPDSLRRKRNLIQQQTEQVLKEQGRKTTLRKKNDVIRGYLFRLGYSKLSSVNRPELQFRIRKHMEERGIWERSDADLNPPTARKRKRSKKILRRNKRVKRKKKRKPLAPPKGNRKARKAVPKKIISPKSPKIKKKQVQMTWVHDSNFKLFFIEEDGRPRK